MSAPQFTPGPWSFADVRSQGTLIYARIDAGERRIGFAGTYVGDSKAGKAKGLGDVEALANARLIAAAPELLAALRALVVGREMSVSHHMWPEVQAALDVMAKAEGRS